jgi:hypothetical protein
MTDITNIEAHLQNLSKSSNTADTLGILTLIQAEIELIITQIAKTIR